MPLSSITVNVGTGGLGRRGLSEDQISGILFYAASYPSGLNSGAPAALCNSLADVVALGITSTDSVFKGLNYQASEFFRLNPNGQLWIGVYPPGTYTFAEIKSLSDAASGKIRQMAVWASARAHTNLAADLTTIAAIIATCDAVGAHMSVGYALNWAALANWNSPTNVRSTNAGRKLSVIIAQDGGGQGKALATALTYSVPALGAWLGCLSKAPVNQSIGQPINFNLSNGVELETLALANGQLINTVGYATLGALKDAGYVIARKYVPQLSGSFFERIPTSTLSTDDFAWIEAVRPVDKATRICEATLTPYLQTALTLNSDGTLSNDTIGFFQDLLISGLNNMKADGEISGFAVLINPAQNVLATSTLVVTIKLLETATAEFITINIGLTTSL